MERWGREVLDRLVLRGDETVLDAGCGSGRVTELLRQRLPHGRVIAVDGSPSMVAVARQRLGDEADLRVTDLLELELDIPVDAVLSTATFPLDSRPRSAVRTAAPRAAGQRPSRRAMRWGR
jgi:trans-aconitate 2-methyltransferase